tara:strand:+ start:18138 stop:18242 length:105 start_codon:yes stop_codon:yes gene_type:complete
MIFDSDIAIVLGLLLIIGISLAIYNEDYNQNGDK